GRALDRQAHQRAPEHRRCANGSVRTSSPWAIEVTSHASTERKMKHIIVAPLVAITSLLGAQVASPTLAQRPAAPAQGWQSESSQSGLLLPPRVDHVVVRASRLHLGMPAAEVERIMGAAAGVETYDGAGASVRVLDFAREPIATKVTLSDGTLSGIALDIAGVDERSLPAYTRAAWLGMHRAAVVRMLGTPTEDRLHDGFGLAVEHLIFCL